MSSTTQPPTPPSTPLSPPATRYTPLLPLLNVAAYLAVIVVNTLANVLPLNGLSTGDISNSFPSLFTPAGYVFAIWGLIYLLLGVFVVFQALPQRRSHSGLRSSPTQTLGYLFIVSCALNIGWLFAWHYLQIPLSMLLMLGLLGTLIVCYQRLNRERAEVGGLEWLVVRAPFSLYLGWITVATVANVSVLLLSLGVQTGWFTPVWALLAVAAATLIGLRVLQQRGDTLFVLVLVWAFVGVAARQWGSEALLMLGALGAAVYLAYAAFQYTIRSRRSGADKIVT